MTVFNIQLTTFLTIEVGSQEPVQAGSSTPLSTCMTFMERGLEGYAPNY